VSLSVLTTTPGSVTDAKCESGKGYLGVEKYAQQYRPTMLLLENVATLFQKRKVEGYAAPFFG